MKKLYTIKKSQTDWKRLKSMKDEEIDFSDTPEVDSSVIAKMVVREPRPKPIVSIRLDPEILEWFKRKGKGYQTRINAVLRSYVEAHRH